MKFPNPWITKFLIAVLTVVLGGLPQAVAQSAQAEQNPPQAPVQGTQVDPARAPVQPVPAPPLPTAPSATANRNQQLAAPQQPTEPPLGAGTAQAGTTIGGAASKPAGTAIAPAKQRQTRSLLIKLGLLAGAGIAIGTVVGLSKASPSKPPGAP